MYEARIGTLTGFCKWTPIAAEKLNWWLERAQRYPRMYQVRFA